MLSEPLFTLRGLYSLREATLAFSTETQRHDPRRLQDRGAGTGQLWPRLEEANMIKQTLTLTAATVVLGAIAFAPASAFAQVRNPNDGGQVSVPAGATLNGGSKSATSTFYGRNADDGGTGPQPTAVQVNTATSKPSKSASAPAPVHLGRAANDGGGVN
jgi:hypothetical protein